jgi:branched-chain amino acid transport system permease protein
MTASSTAPSTAPREATTISAPVDGSAAGALPAASLAPRLMGTRSRWIALGAGVLVLLLFWLLADDRWIAVANAILVYALATLSLNVLSGYTGQVSLGVFFFMAVGGFTAAILSAPPAQSPGDSVGFGLPFYVWLPAAGVAAAIIGALVGPIALRLTGLYLGIVSLALLYVGQYVVKVLPATIAGQNSGRRLAPITIGDFSFSSPQPNNVLGILITDEQAYFILLLAILAVCGLFVANVMRSRAGRAMRAVRDNETAAAIMGVNLLQAKLGAFILSSFLAGLAGALYASYLLGGLAYMPADAGLTLSIGVVAAIIVGGLASVWGSILGAAFVFAIPVVLDKLSLFSQDTNSIFISGSVKIGIFGLFIIIFLLFEPAGVVGLFRRGRFQRPRLANRRRAKGGESAQTPS